MLKGQEIRPALSNPAFEVWLLAHFEQTGTVFADCDAVIRQLDKHWQRAFRRAYDKADSAIYHQLSHLTNTAIANARWVRENHHLGRDVIDGNSSTDVDVLVGTLREKLSALLFAGVPTLELSARAPMHPTQIFGSNRQFQNQYQ